MQYDRTYTQAMSHLTVGNWEETIRLLKPLLNQYPTEKRLYLAILQAATQDFQDIHMRNSANRATASDAWNKLVRLGGVTGEMIQYGRARYEMHIAELNAQKNRILRWIFGAAFCSILAGITLEASGYFGVVLCTCGIAGCLYKVFTSHPAEVIKQLTRGVPDYRCNPFV